MRFEISQSAWRKSSLLMGTIVVLLLAFEIPMFDSEYEAWQTTTREDGPPPAGARLRFSATAYCTGGTTASGVNVRTGIAAGDPRILPVGSVVNVAAGDRRYTGVYTVMDTGPKVKGRILDLYLWSCDEARRFGRKQIDVTVLRLGWSPTASSPRLIDRLFRGREARRAPAVQPPPGAVSPAIGPSTAPVAPESAVGTATTGAPSPTGTFSRPVPPTPAESAR